MGGIMNLGYIAKVLIDKINNDRFKVEYTNTHVTLWYHGEELESFDFYCFQDDAVLNDTLNKSINLIKEAK